MQNNMELGYEMFVISVSRQQMGKAVRNKVCAENPRK